MDFDFKGKMQAVVDLANSKNNDLQQVKAKGDNAATEQKTNEFKQTVKDERDKVFQEAWVYSNDEIDKIKAKTIPVAYRDRVTYASINFKNELQNMDFDKLEAIAEGYIKNGIVDRADTYDCGSVVNLVNELRSRKLNYLSELADKVLEADKNYCTSEPWKKNDLYNEHEAFRNILTAADPEALIDDKGQVIGKISDLIA